MKLPKDLQACVTLARFAKNNGIEIEQAAELVLLARRAFRAGERAANGDASTRFEQQAADVFELAAGKCGFKVEWSGLWPTLKDKQGYDVFLPPLE